MSPLKGPKRLFRPGAKGAGKGGGKGASGWKPKAAKSWGVSKGRVNKAVETAEKKTAAPAAKAVEPGATRAEKKARKQRIIHINKLIGQAGQTKQLSVAREHFASLETEGLKPSEHSWASLINANVRSGDLDGAFAAVSAMKQAGFLPNVVTYTTLIKGVCCSSSNALERADELLAQMEQEGVQPNSRTANTYYRGCVRVGDVARALKFFEKHSKEIDETGREYVAKVAAQALKCLVLKKLTAESKNPAVFVAAAHAAALKGLPKRAGLMIRKGRRFLKSSRSSAPVDAEDPNQSIATFLDLRAKELKGELDAIEKFLNQADGKKLDLMAHFKKTLLFTQHVPESRDEFLTSLKSAARTFGATKDVSFNHAVSPNSEVNWMGVFGNANPVHLEIGAGGGEWCAAQAGADRNVNWAALELRFDRCRQIMTHGIFGSLPNLSVLGGDCRAIVKRLPAKSVAHLFINFPEPPNFRGEGENEDHLYTPELVGELAALLHPGGKVTILSDNLAFIRTLSKLFSAHCDQLVVKGKKWLERVGTLTISGGPAGPDEGHVVASSSYFDRLWEAGSHTKRYHLCGVVREGAVSVGSKEKKKKRKREAEA